MKKSFISLNGAVTLSVISLLVYLGRSFIDFYFVYEELGLSVSVLGLVTLVNLVLFGGWIGGLLATVRGSHRGLIIVFGFNLFFLLVIAVGTLVSYCPSPCRTGWPLGEIFIWLSLVFGLLSSVTSGVQVFIGKQSLRAENASTQEV
jgi:hypothetical protein